MKHDEAPLSKVEIFARRIVLGEKLDSAEDRQFYVNHANEIEAELKKLHHVLANG